MQFGMESKKALDKVVKGRTNLELTIGILQRDSMDIVTVDGGGNVGPDRHLRYEAGSITKAFTASLLAKYVMEGKLDLEASIRTYIPSLPDRYYPPLRRLATHSSGIPAHFPHTKGEVFKTYLSMNRVGGLRYNNPFKGRASERELIELLKEVQVKDKEYAFNYNNFAVAVLGYILGGVTGEGYWNAMNRYVREELALPETRLGHEDTITGYDQKNRPCTHWEWTTEDLVAAAGALSSTAEDLLSFARQNMNEEKPYFGLCHQVHGEGYKLSRMGLGWQLKRDKPYIWHDGNTGSFSSFMGLEKEKKTAVVILTNYGMVTARDLGFALMDELYQE